MTDAVTTIPSDEIDKLWNKARNQLVEAQVECEESLKILSKVRTEMDSSQKSRFKLKFILNCLVNQVEFFKNIMLDKCISTELIDNEWSKLVLVEIVNDVNYWQNEISTKMKILHSTKYDLTDDHSNLSDFICMDHVDILQQKIDEIPIIKQQVTNIRQHYKSIKDRIDNQLVAVKLKKLRTYFDSHFSRDSKNNLFKLLESDYVTELNEFENDLADFLRSITDHFDKCTILKEQQIPLPDLKELFQIVKKDDTQLENIRELVFETGLEVKAFSKKVNETISEIMDKVGGFHQLASKILTELGKCEEYLSIFQKIANLVSVYKESCIKKIEQVQQLCEFYDKFKLGYKNLLRERDRRKATALQMEKILKECQEKLQALSDADLDQRQQFLLENGDYLPENIWPGYIDDMESMYSFEYSIHNVPN
ncbi:Atg17 [Kluyveromyces lactis]|nr:Atg17 [Kluyveromyces lactis]